MEARGGVCEAFCRINGCKIVAILLHQDLSRSDALGSLKFPDKFQIFRILTEDDVVDPLKTAITGKVRSLLCTPGESPACVP